MRNKTTSSIKIHFIGGGNMAGALIGGLCDEMTKTGLTQNRPSRVAAPCRTLVLSAALRLAGTILRKSCKTSAGAICRPEDIHVVDLNAESLQRLKDQCGVTISLKMDEQLRDADVIVLAVKPQQMRDVTAQLALHVNRQLIISIAAGIRFNDLSRWLNGYQTIVRTMPNMPALISKGITGIYAAPDVSDQQRAIVNRIMNTVGTTVWLENEALLDSLTAVSGSGPAYVFYFIEAMQAAAQEMGFNAEQSRQLAMATFLGAAQLAHESTDAVATLRERVTSKGGTTHAAILSMEQSGVGEAIVKAMKAAARRSQELGDEYGR